MNCDFTYDHYRLMLEKALSAGYSFVSFDDEFHDGERYILLRHDIDISLDAALSLAQIEAEFDVKATYFIRTGSTFYNPLNKFGHPQLREILDLGHILGLHFDPESYSNASLSVADGIRIEANLLEEFFNSPVRAISQHRPFSLGEVKNEADKNPLFDYFAYNKLYVEQFKYISDSGQSWREGCLCDNIKDHVWLHVLVHPGWWSEGGTPWKTLMEHMIRSQCEVMQGKCSVLLERYSEYLKNR